MPKVLAVAFSSFGNAVTTAPQDVSGKDAATFEVLRKMREDILCCVLKPDQKMGFGELRQRYGASVGTSREALSHLVSEGLARAEIGRGFRVAPISLDDFLDLSELRVYLETKTLADAIRHGTDAWEAEIVSSFSSSPSNMSVPTFPMPALVMVSTISWRKVSIFSMRETPSPTRIMRD